MPNYGDASYWDERYTQQKNTTFDWLEGWAELKQILEQHTVAGLYKDGMPIEDPDEALRIKGETKILNLGCGNSIICEEMYDEGYQ